MGTPAFARSQVKAAPPEAAQRRRRAVSVHESFGWASRNKFGLSGLLQNPLSETVLHVEVFRHPRRRNTPKPPNHCTFYKGDALAEWPCVFSCSRFVYVIQSVSDPRRYYAGLTTNVSQRLDVHNSGGSQHTRQYRPCRLVVSLEFGSEASATAFEKYLKTGSGRAFAKRHFV